MGMLGKKLWCQDSPQPGPEGLAVQAGAFLTLSLCVWPRAWCDALLVHCSSRTSATHLELSSGLGGKKAPPSHTAGGL